MVALSDELIDGSLPAIRECGRNNHRAACAGAFPHEHIGALEVCLLGRGELEWSVENRTFNVHAGELFFALPGERHGAVRSAVPPCELTWLVVDWAALTDELRLLHDEEVNLRKDLAHTSLRHFEAGSELQQTLRTIVDEHASSKPYTGLATRGHLNVLLALLARETRSQHERTVSAPIQAAVTWLSSHFADTASTQRVAREVGLSLGHLEARFRAELNCSIGEYRTRLRLNAAKHLLRDTDLPITAIAFQLGYSSSQYFATVFRRYAATTPAAYRTQVRTTLLGQHERPQHAIPVSDEGLTPD